MCKSVIQFKNAENVAGSAHDALAQNDDEEYEIQTRKLSL